MKIKYQEIDDRMIKDSEISNGELFSNEITAVIHFLLGSSKRKPTENEIL